jgi:hypothetical protein
MHIDAYFLLRGMAMMRKGEVGAGSLSELVAETETICGKSGKCGPDSYGNRNYMR